MRRTYSILAALLCLALLAGLSACGTAHVEVSEYMNGPMDELAEAMGCMYDITLGSYFHATEQGLRTIAVYESTPGFNGIICSEPGYALFGMVVGEPFKAGKIPKKYTFVPEQHYFYLEGAAPVEAGVFSVDEYGIVKSFTMNAKR